jgi:cob(I)alamin adenosyltransferase
VKIYTKTGDDGTTGLLGKGRVRKDDLRIEAYGTVDELNALIGTARAAGIDTRGDVALARVQNELFAVGSALADPDPAGPFFSTVGAEHVEGLEGLIDATEAELPPLSQFILPGGTPAAAALHLARTVCRRAERQTVRLANAPGQHVAGSVVTYLNRLSDALFVLARAANHREGVSDVPWEGL